MTAMGNRCELSRDWFFDRLPKADFADLVPLTSDTEISARNLEEVLISYGTRTERPDNEVNEVDVAIEGEINDRRTTIGGKFSHFSVPLFVSLSSGRRIARKDRNRRGCAAGEYGSRMAPLGREPFRPRKSK